MSLVLYGHPFSSCTQKVLVALYENATPFAWRVLDGAEAFEELARLWPLRLMPVLVDDDLELFDSTQIFEYLETRKPDPALWPADLKARARARLLEHQSDEVYFPHIIRLMGDPKAPGAHDGAARFYDAMERTLEGRTWLAGGYSFADIAFYMAQLFGERMGAPMTDAHPRLKAWRERMGERPAVRQVAGAMGRYLLSIGRKLPAFLDKVSA